MTDFNSDSPVFAFEFKNGIYLSNDRDGEPSDQNMQFIKKDSTEFLNIDSNIITQTHVDVEFDTKEYSHWSEIETPSLESIFEYQGFDKDVRRWIYPLLGMLLYPMGLYDQWALVVFLHGVEKSGKSTILNLMADIMGSNNVSFTDPGPDVKLLLTDEDIDAPLDRKAMVKNMLAIIPYKSSMIMTSRENPFLPGEHATEHCFFVKFSRTYQGDDKDLKKRLHAERASILRKINEAYLEIAPNYQSAHDLISDLPNDCKL